VPQFSGKYLKKWYLLPAGRHRTGVPNACLEGAFAVRTQDRAKRRLPVANV
jgi:hypothetical protein